MKMDHFYLVFFWKECHDVSVCIIHISLGKSSRLSATHK